MVNWSVSQSEITTISGSLPSDKTYVTYDLEVHTAKDNDPKTPGQVEVTEVPSIYPSCFRNLIQKTKQKKQSSRSPRHRM